MELLTRKPQLGNANYQADCELSSVIVRAYQKSPELAEPPKLFLFLHLGVLEYFYPFQTRMLNIPA